MPGYIELNPSNFFAAVIVRNDSGRLLSRLGHDHVVRALPTQTRLDLNADDLASLRFELNFPVKDLIVDADEDRPRVELPGTVSSKDRDATADNMRARGQLHAAKHPEILFACHGITSGTPAHMHASLTLRGKRVDFDFPLDLHVDQHQLTARGQIELTHADFGLTPYRAPMGALQNRPELIFVVDLNADLIPTS